MLRRVLIIGCLVCFCHVSSTMADSIVLKSGQTIQGDILEQTDDFVRILRTSGREEFYYSFELKDVQQVGVYKKNIQTVFNVKYDITGMESDMVPDSIVQVVERMKEEAHIDLDGVQLIPLERGIRTVQLLKTQRKYLPEGRIEPERYVLRFYYIHPRDFENKLYTFIMTSLKHNRAMTDGDRVRADIADSRKKSSVFGLEGLLDDQMNRSTGDEMALSVSKRFGNIMNSVRKMVTGEAAEEKMEMMNIESFYMTFSEMFSDQENIATGHLDRSIDDYSNAIRLAPEEINNYLWRAENYLEKGEIRRAIIDFDHVLSIDARNKAAYFGRALAHEYIDRYDLAINDYTRIIEMTMKNMDAYELRAMAYMSNGDYVESIQDFNRVIFSGREDAYLYNTRGFARFQMGESKRAIQDYTKALELDPEYFEAYNNRGFAYTAVGELERALEDFNKAVRVDNQIADVYNNRGLVKEYLGNLEGAIRDYSRAIQVDPDLVDAYNNRGIAYHTKEMYRQARNDFSRVIELNPQLADAYLNRSVMAYMIGDFEQSWDDLLAVESLGGAIDPEFQERLSQASGYAY